MFWDVTPIAFSLSWGSIQWPVYWYGLLFAAAFVYGILIFQYLFRREGLPPDDVYDLALYFMAGTLIGARLGHTLLYDPLFYLSHPWAILKTWQGGMASHGALLGVLFAIYLYSRKIKTRSFLWLMDRIGMAAPVSGVLIRIGNFMNSEILGKPTEMPWGVIFARVDMLPRHPVQLYESFCYALIFFILFYDYRQRLPCKPEGWLLGRSLIFIFSARFVLEFFKEGQAAFEAGWSLSVGQLLSIPAILIGLSLVWPKRVRLEPSLQFEKPRTGVD